MILSYSFVLLCSFVSRFFCFTFSVTSVIVDFAFAACFNSAFFFFKQKRAYEMRISDWSSTCALPISGREPLRLAGHGPFHTPLMIGSSDKAKAELPPSLFGRPAIPMVDGRGHVWRRFASDPAEIRDYTFDHQILAPYDFALSVQVAVKEYAPDVVILPGPGDTLGGAIAQALIGIGWQGLDDKGDFVAREQADPVLLAYGRPYRRARVTARAKGRPD